MSHLLVSPTEIRWSPESPGTQCLNSHSCGVFRLPVTERSKAKPAISWSKIMRKTELPKQSAAIDI